MALRGSVDVKVLAEDDLPRVREALRSASQKGDLSSTLSIPGVLTELEQWLEDERQWTQGSGRDWGALLDDLTAAWADAGPEMRTSLVNAAGTARLEVAEVRKELGQKAERDRSTKRRLELAAASIRAALLDEEVLSAAWMDLLEAEGLGDSRKAARLLSGLTGLAGHGAQLFDRLQRILADDGLEIAQARGEELPASYEDVGGASPQERVELVKTQITALPPSGRAVVWMLFAFAAKMWPPVLDVGERLTLYDVSWLRLVSANGGQAAYPVAPEVETNPHFLSLLLPRVEKPKEGPLPPLAPPAVDAHEKVPRVAIRLDLGEVRISEAEDLARSSAEALVALADLHGAESPWVLEDSFVMLVEGHSGGSTFAPPAAFALDSEKRLALSSDTTAEIIARNAEEWAAHFPIADSRMRQAAHLLRWLRKARETWAPGRLILCDRVIERVAAWAGVASPKLFLRDYVRLSWALAQVRHRLAGVAFNAFTSFGSAERADVDSWERYRVGHEEIRTDPDLGLSLGEKSWKVQPWGVIGKLEWLAERVPPDTLAFEEIRFLAGRTESGHALASWVDELMGEFDAMEARRRRVRNALTHGGPAGEEAAAEVLQFVESVAVSALYTSMQGRFRGTSLIDHFLERRRTDERVLAALRAGAVPAEVLWPARRD